MSDLRLVWDTRSLCADLSIEADDILGEDGLETSIQLSLFTNRRAESDDGVSDLQGWWADAVPVVPSDKFGSRLWLLAREKQTPDVLPRAEELALEALQWMIEDKVAEKVQVLASIPLPGVLGLEVSIYRPRVDVVQYHFNHAWTAQESQAA